LTAGCDNGDHAELNTIGGLEKCHSTSDASIELHRGSSLKVPVASLCGKHNQNPPSVTCIAKTSWLIVLASLRNGDCTYTYSQPS